MNVPLFATTTAALLAGGVHLSPEYRPGRALSIVSETEVRMETVELTVERDGEPVDMPFGGGSSEQHRRVEQIERVLEAQDGMPTRVLREFVSVEGESSFAMGDREQDSTIESPLDGVTLELSLDDGEVVAEVVDGSSPDDDSVLAGHELTLPFDALLPDHAVEVGDEWDLDAQALRRAVGADLADKLFPRPAPQERADGEGRRGGRRGRFGRPGGAAIDRLFALGEWEGEAKLAATDEEVGGVAVAVIELTFEGEGELPDSQFRGREGRGGRAFRPAAPRFPRAETFEFEIEGRLLWAIEDHRPVSLELEGEITLEREVERTRGERTMYVHSVQQGTFAHTVEVTEHREEQQ